MREIELSGFLRAPQEEQSVGAVAVYRPQCRGELKRALRRIERLNGCARKQRIPRKRGKVLSRLLSGCSTAGDLGSLHAGRDGALRGQRLRVPARVELLSGLLTKLAQLIGGLS